MAGDTYQLARNTAPAALALVALEAAAAAALALVPPLAALTTPAAAPSLGAATALVVAAAAVVALASTTRPVVVVASAVVTALALGVGVASLPAAAPALQGLGLAFAAPLVVGEALAAGAWIGRAGERLAAAVSLGGAALTTCAAAFLAERWSVDVTALALAVGGVLAQVQLALARVGEARAALSSHDAVEVTAARFGGVARAAALAALGRSGPQGDA